MAEIRAIVVEIAGEELTVPMHEFLEMQRLFRTSVSLMEGQPVLTLASEKPTRPAVEALKRA